MADKKNKAKKKVDRSHTEGKGRPTPKRKDAEKLNERPIVMDRKAAKKHNRELRQRTFERQQAALEGKGDERYLPIEHQGRDRKFMRDYIDSRVTLSQYALPLLLIFVLVSFVGPLVVKNVKVAYYLQIIPVYVMWVVLIMMIFEIVFYVKRINRFLEIREGRPIIKKGNGRYILFRMTALRNSRRPRPQVEVGTIPFTPDFAR